jgi:hypothetical protein
MKTLIVSSMAILLFTATDLAQPPHKQRTPATQTKVVTNIRQVNFNNFSYPTSLFRSQCGVRKTGTVRIISGWGPTYGKCRLYASRTGLGILAGEGNEVAMVNIGCNCGETGVNREAIYADVHFYRIESGQVKLIGKEPSSAQIGSDYLRYYNKSSEEDIDTFGGAIEKGLLTYKLVTRTGPVRNPDSLFGAKLQYRWNGQAFVLIGKPERWRCADYDCDPRR